MGDIYMFIIFIQCNYCLSIISVTVCLYTHYNNHTPPFIISSRRWTSHYIASKYMSPVLPSIVGSAFFFIINPIDHWIVKILYQKKIVLVADYIYIYTISPVFYPKMCHSSPATPNHRRDLWVSSHGST